MAIDIDLTTQSTAPDSAARLLEAMDGELLDLSSGASMVLPLGFEPLDRVLGGGLRLHDLLVLSGRPGVGKTILALQVARNLAATGATVVFASYEHHPRSLLARLLALELGSLRSDSRSWFRPESVRSLLDEVIAGRVSLSSASGDPMLRAARAQVDEYASRLHFVAASPSQTGLPELHAAVRKVQTDSTVLIVDYLQKVRPDTGASSHLEHVARVTSGLKQASLDEAFSVVAVSAVGANGLLRRRTHLPHLDGAVAVGYDSDVVILLNDKRSIVAANRLSNTLDELENLRRRVVFTIEKNRSGIAPIDVEFIKDFEYFRFDPTGSFVAEQLIEDGEHDDFRV